MVEEQDESSDLLWVGQGRAVLPVRSLTLEGLGPEIEGQVLLPFGLHAHHQALEVLHGLTRFQGHRHLAPIAFQEASVQDQPVEG